MAGPFLNAQSDNGGLNVVSYGGTSKTHGSLFWAGLPIKVTAAEPCNFELDLNYGFVEAMGRYDAMPRNDPAAIRRGSTQRQGWLDKASWNTCWTGTCPASSAGTARAMKARSPFC